MRKPRGEKPETNKGAWSKQEDEKLIDYIRTHGEGRWRTLPQAAGLLRCGKSCRLRWINYLRPDLKRGQFSEDEEDLVIKLHALLGNRWSLIAGRLPGRTDNEVKNYWNSHLRRKLVEKGLDPNNHRLISNGFPALASARRPDYSVALVNATNRLGTGTSSIRACERCDRQHDQEASDDRISDEGSCLEDADSRALPDLNLSLGISPQFPEAFDDTHMRRYPGAAAIENNPDHEASSPAILLFR